MEKIKPRACLLLAIRSRLAAPFRLSHLICSPFLLWWICPRGSLHHKPFSQWRFVASSFSFLQCFFSLIFYSWCFFFFCWFLICFLLVFMFLLMISPLGSVLFLLPIFSTDWMSPPPVYVRIFWPADGLQRIRNPDKVQVDHFVKIEVVSAALLINPYFISAFYS